MTDGQQTPPRTRTITWDDPMVGAQFGLGKSGLDYMHAMLAGQVPSPPISILMNFRLAEVENGRALFLCTPDEFHYNPIGVVHGGLICTLCDSACGCAVHTTLPAGMAYTTLDVHVHMTRPLSAQTGEIRCEGRVLHAGRRMATAEAKVTDARGKLYGHATSTCMIFPLNEG